MKEESNTYYQNPKVDYLFGYVGDLIVPTRQGDYRPIPNEKNENGEDILNNYYVKKPATASQNDFRNYIQGLSKEIFKNIRIDKPQEIEVLISVSMLEKRYRSVDVDNIAKAVLDSMKEIVFEDDSQIANLIIKKFIYSENSILIGITRLTEENKGFCNNLSLFSSEPYK
ncbi:MAG: RusA family crossover junction endodeoxyribonuclease [Pedobacter sp.]|nr:MAG: RusA family crossover junction endodeoxyribonuclease [Pedobacter sp.]